MILKQVGNFRFKCFVTGVWWPLAKILWTWNRVCLDNIWGWWTRFMSCYFLNEWCNFLFQRWLGRVTCSGSVTSSAAAEAASLVPETAQPLAGCLLWGEKEHGTVMVTTPPCLRYIERDISWPHSSCHTGPEYQDLWQLLLQVWGQTSANGHLSLRGLGPGHGVWPHKICLFNQVRRYTKIYKLKPSF